MDKPTISLCIIHKNDSDNLKRLINEARPHVDEIVVVDTGSTDGSTDSIKEMVDIFYQERDKEFSDENGDMVDFSKPRNKSWELATKDLLFWLDSDDTLSSWDVFKEDIEWFMAQLETQAEMVCALRLNYQYSFINTPSGERISTQTYPRERVVRKCDQTRWTDPVHEYIETASGKSLTTMRGRAEVIHLSDGARGIENGRNLRILRAAEARENQTSKQKAKTFYYIADELMARKQYSDAISYFEKSINEGDWFYPERSLFRLLFCWYNWNLHQFNQEKYMKIFDYLNRYVQYTKYANFGWYLAMVHNTFGDREQAVRNFYETFGLPTITGENNLLGMQVARSIFGCDKCHKND